MTDFLFYLSLCGNFLMVALAALVPLTLVYIFTNCLEVEDNA